MADYYFNFPPITSLTIPQQSALNEPSAIALSGGPGTGKSFVSLWRHISNHEKENPVRSQLLTFTTSLAYYLKASSGSRNDVAADYVDSICHWYTFCCAEREEIIVDEAQDMPLVFYEADDRIRQYSDKISYGADNKQILVAGAVGLDGTFNVGVCSPEEELQRIFNNKVFVLDQNFRNTKAILEFAKAVFLDAYIPPEEIASCQQEGDKPSFLITKGDIKKQNDAIVNIVSQFSENPNSNIGILTPLAKIPWAGGEIYTAKYYYDLLMNSVRPDGSRFDCSYHDWSMQRVNQMKNIHITPFKSAKGLEFDTVIIPCFDALFKSFRVVNWRDFFVGITRAKSNLYLFSESERPNLDSVIDKQFL